MKQVVLFFVQRKISALMLFLVIFLAGIFSIQHIPTSLMPSAETQGITISIKYPGQSPWRIERLITKPVENAIGPIGGISEILSSSRDDESKIYVMFQAGVRMKYKSFEIRDRIEPVRSNFPRDVQEPAIYMHTNDNSPSVILHVTSDVYSLNELREITELKLKKQVERVNGVSEIMIGGGTRREIQVRVRPGRLLSHGLTLQHVMDCLQQNNFVSPGGTLSNTETYGKDFSIMMNGRFQSIDDIRNTPVLSASSGSPVLLKDIARISDYSGKKESIARVNGKEHVSLYIFKTSTANPVTVSQHIRKLLSNRNIDNLTISTGYDQAEYISKAVKNLMTSCVLGILLAVIVLFIFLRRIEITLPIIIAIPFSLLVVCCYLYFSGKSFNVITLSGLAIAAGLVVDNSIIVLENIQKHVAGVRSPTGNSIADASYSVFKALLASTLTSICIFIPVILFRDAYKSIYGELAGTVIVALLASFAVSITLLPSLFSFLSDNTFQKITAHARKGYIHVRAIFPCSALWKLPFINPGPQSPVYTVKKRMMQLYKRIPSYESTLLLCFQNSKKYAIRGIILVILTVIIGGTGIKKGNLSINDSRDIMATLEMPSGTSLEATSKKAVLLESRFEQIENVTDVSVKVEKSSADFVIKTHHTADKKSTTKLLKTSTRDITNGSVFFQQDDSSGYSDSIDMEISGPNINVIRDITRRLAAAINPWHGIEDVILRFKEKRPELHIMIDRDKTAATGLSMAQAGSVIRNSLYGPVATKFIDRHEVDIRAELDIDDKNKIHQLAGIHLPVPEDKQVPLGAVAGFNTTTGLNMIWRKNKVRMEALTVNHDGLDMQSLVNRIQNTVDTMNIPSGYHVSFGQSIEKFTSSQQSIRISILLAILLVYMVTAAVFESITLPLLVITAIPFSAIMVILTMALTGLSLNFSTGMGFVVLIGIVVNNAIVLIDTYQVNLTDNTITKENIITLSRSRVRPVMMTTLTTTLGMLPLLFTSQGSTLWQGFALTIITGLTGATVLVLFVIPVGYYYLKKSPQRPRDTEKNVRV
ncbi:MAG: efflux RND transporter permease subunit [Spirochaetota bacterium]